jgi:hypothetical protein
MLYCGFAGHGDSAVRSKADGALSSWPRVGSPTLRRVEGARRRSEGNARSPPRSPATQWNPQYEIKSRN